MKGAGHEPEAPHLHHRAARLGSEWKRALLGSLRGQVWHRRPTAIVQNGEPKMPEDQTGTRRHDIILFVCGTSGDSKSPKAMGPRSFRFSGVA